MATETKKDEQVAPDTITDDPSRDFRLESRCYQQPCPILRELGIWGNQAWGGEKECTNCLEKECIYDTLERRKVHRAVLHNRL